MSSMRGVRFAVCAGKASPESVEQQRIHARVRCEACGGKVMELMAHRLGARFPCISCQEVQRAAIP